MTNDIKKITNVMLNIKTKQIDIPLSFVCGKEQILKSKELDPYMTIGIIKESEVGLWCDDIGVNIIPDEITYSDFIVNIIKNGKTQSTPSTFLKLSRMQKDKDGILCSKQ